MIKEFLILAWLFIQIIWAALLFIGIAGFAISIVAYMAGYEGLIGYGFALFVIGWATSTITQMHDAGRSRRRW